MSDALPRFHLTRVYADGSSEPPQIASIGQLPIEAQMGRRGFFKIAGLTGAAVTATGVSPPLWAQPADSVSPSSETVAEANERCGDDVVASTGPVSEILFHPNGQLIAGGHREDIRVWTVPSGRPRTLLRMDEGYVLALKPNGEELLVAGQEIRVLSWPSGREVFRSPKHEAWIQKFAISPDGKFGACLLDGRLQLLDMSDKLSELASVKDDSLLSIAFSPDSRWVATGTRGGRVDIRSLPDLTLVKSLKHPTSTYVFSVAFAPVGDTLASASTDSLCLWTLPEGDLKATLPVAGGGSDLAFNPDGKLLAAGYMVAPIHLLSLPEAKLMARLGDARKRNGSYLSGSDAIAFSPDGRFLAAGGFARLALWSVADLALASCFFDAKALDPTSKVNQYKRQLTSGEWTTFSQACGSPIPPGAVCTCNCVSGKFVQPRVKSKSTTICTCNQICTCVPVYR